MSETPQKRKGILLAGGYGTRLYPVTVAVSKQLLPVYNKPMVYYPLSILMLAGIREVLIITSPRDKDAFERLLGDGTAFGLRLEYQVQMEPKGVAEAFLLAEGFLQGAPACLILGDNLYYGQGISSLLQAANEQRQKSSIFTMKVAEPTRYGIVELNAEGVAVSIEEKPAKPKSSLAVTGLYFFDNQVCQVAKSVKPSGRGELEITDVIDYYLQQGCLEVFTLGRGVAWFDTGTHDSMVEAIEFVKAIEKRTGQMIACLEEIAWLNGWISSKQLRQSAEVCSKSDYGAYLRSLSGEEAHT